MKKIGLELVDFIIFFIIIMICFGALMAFYPGLLTSDSVTQIEQSVQNQYSDAHPVLHSFIVGSLYRINNSVSNVCAFQILMFAFVWTKACKVLRKHKNQKSHKILQVLITIIIGILPINFIHSIIIWKDIIFSYSILGILIYIYIGIREEYKYTYVDMFIFSLFLVLVMKIRHNGLVISPIILVIILFMSYKKNKKIKDIIVFIVLFISIFIICCLPEKLCNVKKTAFESDVLTSSRLFCMGAILNSDVEIEEEDYKFLDTILPIEEWKESYNRYHGLNIFYNEDYDAKFLTEHNEQFKNVFRKYAKQKPKVVLDHYIWLNSITWSIKQYGYMNSIFTSNIVIREMSNRKI